MENTIVEDFRSVHFLVESQVETPRQIARNITRKDLPYLPRVGEFVCLNEGVFEITGIQYDLRDYYLGTISIFLKDPNKKELV